MDTLTDNRRRVGRPRVADDPRERERHFQAAEYRIVRRLTIGEVAILHDVSPRTVVNWIRLALAYDDERSEALRRIQLRVSRIASF